MMKCSIFFLFVISLLFSACQPEWKDPNKTLPSAKVEITSILATPNVYDSAGVKLTGMVWDKERIDPPPAAVEGEDGEITDPEPYTHFKLSDPKGYYVGVITDDTTSFEDGDIVEVVGIFRRNFAATSHHFKNEVDAREITVIESLRRKYEEQ